jgi:N-acetylglutamate synthase-like GNAT family acetyltransferase
MGNVARTNHCMNYLLNLTPTKEQLLETKAWLTQELENSGEGFMNNWNIIEDYFDRKQLILLLHESKTIGFTTWDIVDEIALNIDIAVIHPNFRSKGAGKFMMGESFKYLKSKDILVAKLFCQPSSSEPFWKSLGFIDMPETAYHQHDLALYLPLIETRQTTNALHESNVIELWNCEPYRASDESPKWIWNISGTHLNPPILVPCDRNWNIRHIRDGEVIKEGKVKYFSQINPVDKSDFLFINELH